MSFAQMLRLLLIEIQKLKEIKKEQPPTFDGEFTVDTATLRKAVNNK
jgi:hypothetical protein